MTMPGALYLIAGHRVNNQSFREKMSDLNDWPNINDIEYIQALPECYRSVIVFWPTGLICHFWPKFCVTGALLERYRVPKSVCYWSPLKGEPVHTHTLR